MSILRSVLWCALVCTAVLTASLPPAAAQNVAFGNENNEHVQLTADARLKEGLDPVAEGMVWRIYGVDPEENGQLPVLHETRDALLKVSIRPGTYVLSAAYGRAVITKKVDVSTLSIHVLFVLNAGAIRLTGKVASERELPADQVRFSIFPIDSVEPIIENAVAGATLRLPAGDYRIVSLYGANAQVEAEVLVEAGKLSDAEIHHQAATVALRLVRSVGGKAQVNTSWAILSSKGERIAQLEASLVRLILQEGRYTAIAKHEGQNYQRNFVVENGIDRDVEVLLEP